MRRSALGAVVALAVVLLLLLPGARAHQASVAYLRLALDGREVVFSAQLSQLDLGPALGLEGERAATRDDLAARRAVLFDYLATHLTVSNDGLPCPPRADALDLDERGSVFFAVATLRFACKRTAADVTVHYDLFFDNDPRHQGLARVESASGARDFIFRADARELRLAQPVALVDHLRDYLRLGIEHIFTGYDHLAFLFALLVVAGLDRLRAGLRYVLGVVTAFTVAHSCTLVAAGLGWVRLPPRVVEPAIALSIAYVAVENLVVARPRHRWLLTFGFGLVHGFGFASVLREIGLPPRGLVLSLLSFNVGVELGQLAVVAAVAPALHLFTRARLAAQHYAAMAALAAAVFALLSRFALPRAPLAAVTFGVPVAVLMALPRYGYDRVVRRAGSIALAALAALWFFERILERTFLGGALG